MFELLVLLGIGVIILMLRYYMPSYFSKKGANLATKEDISEITKRMESVKVEYAKEIEFLKANLNLHLSKQSSYLENQRLSLQDFFQSCIALFDKLSQNPPDLPMDSLFEYAREVKSEFSRTYTNYHRLLLYFDSSAEVAEAAEDVAKSSMELCRDFTNGFRSIKVALVNEEDAIRSGDKKKMHEAALKTNETAKAFWSHFGPKRDEMFESFFKYTKSLNLFLKAQGSKQIIEPNRM